jgi:hypothetical protein
MARSARRTAWSMVAVVVGLASVFLPDAIVARANDPLAMFHPAVTLTSDDYARLGRDLAVVKMLPAHGNQIAAFTTVRTKADGPTAVAWLRNICALKQGPYLKACARVSSPPRLEDFAALTLDDNDVNDIRRCKPNDCALKLSADDLRELQGAVKAGGASWKREVQSTFRRLMFERVRRHVTAKAGAPPPSSPLTSQDGFGRFAELAGFRWRPAPAADPHARRLLEVSGGESFIYWSKEQLGGKPIVGIMDITVVSPPPGTGVSAIAASTQLYASHYMEASIGVTALVPGDGGWNFLVYTNRSDVDLLGGFWSGIARMVMNRRIRNESADLLLAIRHRMEKGGR